MGECYLQGQNGQSGTSIQPLTQKDALYESYIGANKTITSETPIKFIAYLISSETDTRCFIDVVGKRYFWYSPTVETSVRAFNTSEEIADLSYFTPLANGNYNYPSFGLSSDNKTLTVYVPSGYIRLTYFI